MKKAMKKLLKNPSIMKILAKIFGQFKEAFYNQQYAEYRKKYNLDPTFNFNGEGIFFYGDGKIQCGKNSYIGRYSSIQAEDGRQVFIGNNVAISHFVMIYTATRDARHGFYKDAEIKKGDVFIKDNSWIGARVFIKEGITIGENSVVGANAVVTKDIPSNCVAGGVPARVLYYKEDVNTNV